MDLWQAAAELIQTLLERHAVLTVFVLVLLEESGLPLPLPSDVAVLLAGSQIGRGRVNPIPAFLAAELAAVVGGSILYTIARRGGRPLLRRFSRLVRIKPEHLDRAEAAVQRDGLRAVMVGRW